MTHRMEDYININEIGCWIDGSHISASELDINIISLALRFGFVLDREAVILTSDVQGEVTEDNLAEDLYDLAQHAIEWLNEKAPEGFYFYVDDSCLFLSHKSEEGTEYNV